ncbi:hypothetical protein FRC00_000228 [Tulasnella sp. 408]|nr:hypothetical protein FRC00_000228 [Tulasnella sp. 408]
MATKTTAQMELALKEHLDQLFSDAFASPSDDIWFRFTRSGSRAGSITLEFKIEARGITGKATLCGKAVDNLKAVAKFLATTSATGEDNLGCICGCGEGRQYPNLVAELGDQLVVTLD